jgi:hypothetical protein
MTIEEKCNWEGVENDSPFQLLDRFSKRFPDTTESDIVKFASVIGIGETVVKQYLMRSSP